MRKRKLKGGLAVLSLAAALCVANGAVTYADETGGSDVLRSVDQSKGIEYRYYEGSTTAIEGIVLNGNSVIIKQSPNSTDSDSWINIYNDKDRDGVLDEGEEAFEIDGSSDIRPYQVFGVYGEKTVEPVSITLDGVYMGNIWGIYKGSIESAGETPAVTISVKEGTMINKAVGVYDSDAVGTLKVDISGKCTVKQAEAADKAKLSGDVDVDVAGNAFVETLTGMMDSYGTGNVDIHADGTVDISTLNGVHSSTIDGDLICDISYAAGNSSSSAYGATNGTYRDKNNKSMDYAVKGNVNFTVKNAQINSLYGATNGAAVQGDLKVDVCSTKSGYMCGSSNSAIVGGNAVIKVDGMENSGYINVCGISSSTVIGNLTLDVKSLKGSNISFSGSYNSVVNGNVDIDVDGGGEKFSTVYGFQSGSLGGTSDINIQNMSITSSLYGLYSGKMEQTEPADEDAYANVITFKNIKSDSYYNCGSQGMTSMGSTHVTMENVTTSGYLYGLSFPNAVYGKVRVDMSGCTAGNGYAVDGNDSNSSGVTGEVEVNMTDCYFNSDLYLLYSAVYTENVSLNVQNVISNRCTVAYYGTCKKNLNLKMLYANDQTTVDGNGDPVVDSYSNAGKGDFNILSGFAVWGDMNAELSNIHYASCGLAGGSYSSMISGKNVVIDLKNSSFTTTTTMSTTVYMMNEDTVVSNLDPNEKLTAQLNVINTDFTGMKDASFQLSPNQNRSVRVSFDEECKLPDGYYMCPSYNYNGDVIMTYGGDIYYGGNKVVIDQDVTADNIYFGNSASGKSTSSVAAEIKKGVKITAQEGIYVTNGANILNSGTFEGTFKRLDTNTPGSIYMKEGVITDDGVYENAKVYYPISLEYNEKAVITSSLGSGMQIDNDTKYAEVDSEQSMIATVKRGYTLEKVVYRGQDETQDNETVGTSGKYTFVMPRKPCTVKVVTKGKQIKASKTKADPSAVLRQKYTAETPLYDMADVVILNDAKDGTVSYEVDKNYLLPEGLELTDGLITGTPTMAYEDGKKVVIHITGKNDTKTQVTLNVIVSKDQKVQDNTDGRILVDDENKKVCLNGTSVVIQAREAQAADDAAESSVITEIYADDDKDGNADSKTPMCSGDLSEYTVVGVDDSVFNRSISITMLGGNVKALYGAVDSEISYDGGVAVAVRLRGGHAEEAYTLVDTKVVGTIVYEVADGTQDKGSIAPGSTSSYTGALTRTNDSVSIAGEYTVYDKLTADVIDVESNAIVKFEGSVEVATSFRVNSTAMVVIADTLKTGNLNLYAGAVVEVNGNAKVKALNMNGYNAMLTIGEETFFETQSVSSTTGYYRVYQKGTFSCPADSFSNRSIWVKAGDFAEGVDASTWNGIYYKVDGYQTNMKGTNVSIPVQNYAVEYDGQMYVKNNSKISVNYTDVKGYTVYVSANGGEPVLGSAGSASVESVNGSISVTADYVANQISVSKKYADPVIAADHTYTAEEPAYDLTALDVTDDTTSAYGTDMQYRVKSGSKLPDGLVLDNGMVTGKPSDAGETDVTFVVTGRNGTSVDVDVKFTVKSSGAEIPDINDLITGATLSSINLAGNSVVIIEDPESTSRSAIYLDEDHDGIADNNRALKIAGETSYDLSGCKIYGYKDSENAYAGDISITLRSGTVGALYGAGSSEKNAARVTVDGDVTVKVLGGKVKTELYGAYNADIATLNFDAEGGRIYKKAYGAYNSQMQDMNFAFVGAAKMYADTNKSSTGKLYLYVTSGGRVIGDANVQIGTTDSAFVYGISQYTSSYSYFGGVNGTAVGGNVNYILDGNWYAADLNTMVNRSNIEGDLNVELKSGRLTCGQSNDNLRAIAAGDRNNSIRNINVKSATEDTVTGNVTIVSGYTVNDIYFNDVSGKTTATVTGLSTSFAPTHTGSLFIKTKYGLTLGGTYKVNEDIDTGELNVLKDAKITVAEGVKVTHGSSATITGDVENNGTWESNGTLTLTGTFVNKGTWNINKSAHLGDTGVASDKGWVDNYGTVKTVSSKSYLTRIYANAKFINRENAYYEFGYFSNSGAIVNYGELKENYYNTTSSIGVVYTTSTPHFKYQLKNYSKVYYKVDVEYPAYCFKDENAGIEIGAVSSTYQKTSGIEGDDNIYICGNSAFYVSINGEPIDGMKVDSVAYGSAQSQATSNDNIKWTGYVVYEPTTAVINMAKQEATNITLAKTEDTVTAQVGKTTYAYKPLYDLTAIEIQNDETIDNGYVAYSLASGQTLPAGLVMANGKIYGTPTKAADEAQTVKFNVRGQNQTMAEFTLTIEKIEKGIPQLEGAKAGDAYAGKTLADVKLPTSSQGVYSWADSSQVVGKAGTKSDYDAYFAPNDTANYDWSMIDAASGTYEQLEDGSVRISVKLSVYVRKQDPVFTVPEGVTAIYGDTLSKAVVPETEGGMFIWENADESVGEVGTNTFFATFVPSDEDIYERAEHIEIQVEVKPAAAKFTQAIDKLTVKENGTLADIGLPDRDDGIYTWYTDRSTQVVDGGMYSLCFKPADTKNYDWTGVTGWNRAHRGVVFTVKVEIYKEHVHEYGSVYKNDATSHWYECTCGDVKDKEDHTFDKGEINKSPTDTASGIKVYKCTKCEYIKTEKIPALGRDIANTAYKIIVSGVTDQNYTGNDVTLKNLKLTRNKTTLRNGTDYTVKYYNNKKRGTAKVVITGKGNYRGTITKTFKISIAKNSVFAIKQGNTNVVYRYKVTNAATNGKGTVALIGTTKAKTDRKYLTVVLSDAVSIDGVKFNVTAIGPKAFMGYKYITKVSGGKNLTVIGDNAFRGCISLIRMPIGNGVKTIGQYAFCGCKKLGNVALGANVTTIGQYAFYGCEKFTSVTLGSRVTTIGKGAYKKCTSLTAVTIGAGVKTIGESAFESCKKLKTVAIKTTKLSKVCKNAFKGVASNVTFKIPKKKYTAYVKAIKAKTVATPSKAVYIKY